ncbi:MAG: amidohydrolase family protein [Planctomycetota bacterium]|nr:amidohydrolase family protein [Planctomycetota bacterium]MDA1139371.1 amidohydrolase family protein [Planctomycetota bacterium]
MIIDVNTWAGHCWALPVDGSVEAVCASLHAVDVGMCFLSPMSAAWFPNPHSCNGEVYEATNEQVEISPVPILSPRMSTWREELKTAANHSSVKAVKLLPAYHGYELQDANELFAELSKTELVVIVQTRLEDPRRHHPLAQIPDVSAEAVAAIAHTFGDLQIIIGGPRSYEIAALGEKLLRLPNLWADVSQADGMDQVKLFVESGLTDKLLFGSHAPFFIPHSAVLRVVNDLEDADAEAILCGNAMRLFRL